MEIREAWRRFTRTGKVEDYIRYAQVRDQLERGIHASGEVPFADQNPGPGDTRTDGGGERPPSDDPHAG